MSWNGALFRAAAVGLAVALLGCEPEAVLEGEAADCPSFAARPLGESRLLLVNAYFLQEEATRALRRGGSGPPAVLDEVFSKARAMGAGAVRTWAFNDDPAKAGDSAIQVAPLQYDELSLRGLDWVLARAHLHGLKLILPLGNGWSDYGGARQYVAWANLPDPVAQDGRFYTSPEVVAHYKAHLSRLLGRVSSVDGLRYADHPAVLAWEVLNEPRGEGLDALAVAAWVQEVAAHLKRLAPSHLVGSGEEGFDGEVGFGASFQRNSASPAIDYAGIHLFPESWGWSPLETARRGARWISERAQAAHALNKPLLLGELGLRNDGAFSLLERRAIYRGWLACARASGVAAMGPWMLADDARPDGWDHHTFYWRDGAHAADERNRYVDLMLEAAAGL